MGNAEKKRFRRRIASKSFIDRMTSADADPDEAAREHRRKAAAEQQLGEGTADSLRGTGKDPDSK